MRYRRSPALPIALRLTGLSTPDAGAADRMAAFDALSPSFRRELAECPFDFNAPKALAAVRDRGAGETLRLVRVSIINERRIWARDRAAALAWARNVFRIGPRPKHEPPPEG